MIASSMREIETKEIIDGKIIMVICLELQDNLFLEFIKELKKPKIRDCSVKRQIEKEEKNCLVNFYNFRKYKSH
jgi:hypothetical protein